jgi:hypothetical protein
VCDRNATSIQVRVRTYLAPRATIRKVPANQAHTNLDIWAQGWHVHVYICVCMPLCDVCTWVHDMCTCTLVYRMCVWHVCTYVRVQCVHLFGMYMTCVCMWVHTCIFKLKSHSPEWRRNRCRQVEELSSQL